MDKFTLLKNKILNDEDFINSAAFKNSLNNLLQKYQDGVENDYIAKVLMMNEKEVENIYQEAIETLRRDLGEKD